MYVLIQCIIEKAAQHSVEQSRAQKCMKPDAPSKFNKMNSFVRVKELLIARTMTTVSDNLFYAQQ